MRKRLLPILLFDKTAASENTAATPQLPSVLGGEAGVPLFPELSAADQQSLMEYLHASENNPPLETKQIMQPDKDGNDVAWTDADELNQWSKLRIFQSASNGQEERTVGKVLCVDNKCKEFIQMAKEQGMMKHD